VGPEFLTFAIENYSKLFSYTASGKAISTFLAKDFCEYDDNNFLTTYFYA
jgi:hypothetical protein